MLPNSDSPEGVLRKLTYPRPSPWKVHLITPGRGLLREEECVQHTFPLAGAALPVSAALPGTRTGPCWEAASPWSHLGKLGELHNQHIQTTQNSAPEWNRRPVHIVMVVAIYKTIKKNGLASCPGGHSLSRHLAYKLTLSRTGRHRESWTQTSGTRLSTPPAGSSPNGKAPCSSRQWPHTQLSSHRWEAPSEVSGVHLASPQPSLLFW